MSDAQDNRKTRTDLERDNRSVSQDRVNEMSRNRAFFAENKRGDQRLDRADQRMFLDSYGYSRPKSKRTNRKTKRSASR